MLKYRPSAAIEPDSDALEHEKCGRVVQLGETQSTWNVCGPAHISERCAMITDTRLVTNLDLGGTPTEPAPQGTSHGDLGRGSDTTRHGDGGLGRWGLLR